VLLAATEYKHASSIHYLVQYGANVYTMQGKGVGGLAAVTCNFYQRRASACIGICSLGSYHF
jgi:hypothetical protein